MHACHVRARKEARNSTKIKPIRENPLPANKKLNQCSLNIGHRLRRWPSIEPALGQCIVFAGIFPMQNRRDARDIICARVVMFYALGVLYYFRLVTMG